MTAGGSARSLPRASTGRAVAVVGAGIVGCLIARQLADADADAVITVLDRDLVGSGASRRSAGLFIPRGATPRTKQMSAASHDYYANLKASRPELPIFPVAATVRTDGRTDPATIGYLPGLAAPTEPGPRDSGGEPRWIAESTPENRGELPNPPDGRRSWRISGCHYADVYRVTQAIAELARPRVRFAEGVAVTGLAMSRAGVIVHCGTGEQLRADQVVLAPGPWLGAPAWRDLLSPLGLRVKKIVAMHIEQRPGPADKVTLFDGDDAFLLPVWHRGHWLFSYACTEWDVDPDQLTGGLSAANLAEARACLRRCAPDLAGAAASGRVCADAYSPAREPVISVLDGTQGRVVFAGGAGGSGYRLAPAIAAEAVDALGGRVGGGRVLGGGRVVAGGRVLEEKEVSDDHQYV